MKPAQTINDPAIQKSYHSQTVLFCFLQLHVMHPVTYMMVNRCSDAVLRFFRLLNQLYEKTSIILKSNKGFADLGEMYGENVLATAILDRLLHHSTTLNIKGENYWLKEKSKDEVLTKNTTPINDDEMAVRGQPKLANRGH
ncbi:ATP-binding protein [Enterobacter cloacae]|nr:ATP-binding protein [Enterobacter cloacae]